MPVCPKCGFNGQDQDSCERCGIIYSRMHTVMEARPVGQDAPPKRPSGSMPRIPTPSSVPPARPAPVSSEPIIEVDTSEFDPSASTVPDGTPPYVPSRPSSRSVPSIAQAFPGMQSIPPGRLGEPTPGPNSRPPREVTAVPILPPPPAPKSKAPWLIGLLGVCVLAWGTFSWVDRHRSDKNASDEVDSSAGQEYFEFQMSELIDEARRTFRDVKDLETGRKNREAFGVRVRYLRTRVATGSLDDAKKQIVTKALDEVASFLKEDVGGILTALEAEKVKAAAEKAAEEGEAAEPSPSPTPIASASPAPTPAPALDVKPAVAAPVNRKPSMAALNRATSALAGLKTE